MRVLIVSNIYPGEDSPSFGTFVSNQVQALTKQGVTCLLAVNSDPRQGIRYVLPKYLRMMLTILRLSICGGYDIVHAHYIFPSAFFALLPCLLRQKPLIVTAHGGDIERMPYRNKVIFALTRFTLRKATTIVSVSTYLKQEIVYRFDISADKIVVSSMGVDLNRFRQLSQDEARSVTGHNREINRKVILYIGRCTNLKGGQYLLEAFSLFSQDWGNGIELWFVGDGQDLPSWKLLTEEYGVTEQTQFFSGRPQNEIPAWLSLADVFVLPTLTESFGLVIVEAMACGVPVVASRVGGVPELIQDEVSGLLVAPKSASDLAMQIDRVLRDPELAQSLVNNAYQGINRYSVETQSRLVKGLYSKAMDDSTAKRA